MRREERGVGKIKMARKENAKEATDNRRRTTVRGYDLGQMLRS